MEFEQFGKRLEWLDEQQRQSKTSVGDMVRRLAALETSVNALAQQFKMLSKDLTEVPPVNARIDQFEGMMTKQRADLAKIIETVEKAAMKREQEIQKIYQTELEEIRRSIFEVSKSVNTDEIYKRIKERTREEQRLTTMVQDMRSSVEMVAGQNKDLVQAIKALEDGRRQDSKRVGDLLGEIAAVRKRAEDARDRSSVHADAIRNVEHRIGELLETETARQEAQTAFLAQQSVALVDRDRTWKEWQVKFDHFREQAEKMEGQVTTLDDSIRAARRAQESYTDLNQRLERRIAEVGEMQRLAEDRIRQEWVAFKADEQKRWTGHSLSQEESIRDLRKAVDKFDHRVTALDDISQTIQDQINQTTESTEQQLQELMNVANEWLTAYERIMGHGKTKAKKTSH
jgi:DNA repair exonuclease SbcCD ATPase subunit